MFRSLRNCLFVALAMLSDGWSFSESAPPVLTVDQSVDLALRHNVDVQNSDSQVAALQRAKDHSFNAFYPTVSTSATVSRLNDPQSHTTLVSPEPLPSGTYVTPDAHTLGLSFQVQEIFTPAIIARFAQMDLDLKNALISRKQAERSMTASIRTSFFRLLLLKETMELTQSQVKNAEERLRQSEVSFRLGQATELSYVQNQADVDNLKPQLQQQIVAYTNNLVIFQELLGLDPRTDLVLDGRLDGAPVELPDTASLAAHRLDAQAQEGQKNNWQTNRDLLVLQVLPALTLQYSADPSINAPQNKNLLDDSQWSQQSGATSLTLSWNLESFIPGSSFWDKQKEFEDRITLAQKRLEEIRKKGIDDIENHKRSIQTSLSSIDQLRNAVKSNQRALELTSVSYKLGTGRLLDLQNAELNAESATIRLLNEEFTLKSLVFELEAQLDRDLETFQSGR